jgi:hypothetical protein
MDWAGAAHPLSRGLARDEAAEVVGLSPGDREVPALPAGNRSNSACESPAGNSTSSNIGRRGRRRAAQPTVVILGPSPPLVKRIPERKPALPGVRATSPKSGCFGLASISPK